MPRFPSTNPGGLRAASRVAACQGMFRPSRSPDWSAVVGSLGTRIVTPAAAKHSIRRQIEERLQFCALLVDGACQGVRPCPRESLFGDAKGTKEVGMRQRLKWLLLLFSAAIVVTVIFYAGKVGATPSSGFKAMTIATGTFDEIDAFNQSS